MAGIRWFFPVLSAEESINFTVTSGGFMIINCPHCKNNVLVKSDNICPACKKNVNDYSSQQLLKSKISIKNTEALPDICFNCGEKSEKILKLRYNNKQKRKAINNTLGTFLFWLFGLLSVIIELFIARSPSIIFHIPVCEKCYKTTKDKSQYYINFNTKKIDIIVHKNFLRKLKR